MIIKIPSKVIDFENVIVCDSCQESSDNDDIIRKFLIGPYVVELHGRCTDLVRIRAAESIGVNPNSITVRYLGKINV